METYDWFGKDKGIKRYLPADCRTATALPAATPPPLAIAAADIILAATDPAAIPAEVKPAAPRTTGARATIATAYLHERIVIF